MGDDHDHNHDHNHDHDHDGARDPALRVRVIEEILAERGLIDPAALDALIETYEHKVGPHNGARVVARSWVDPAFRERLRTDSMAAIREFGFPQLGADRIEAVENDADTHNVVVCTLCSCYPWPTLGLPPSWYKSLAYRSRIVKEPRQVLAEFGLDLPPHVELRVWDATADLRYLVIPERPPGTEGLSEDELARLVTRDSMIGVARALDPQAAGLA